MTKISSSKGKGVGKHVTLLERAESLRIKGPQDRYGDLDRLLDLTELMLAFVKGRIAYAQAGTVLGIRPSGVGSKAAAVLRQAHRAGLIRIEMVDSTQPTPVSITAIKKKTGRK